MLKIKDKPGIIDVCVDCKENCFPMIPSGKNHNEMILGSDADNSGSAIEGGGMVLV